MINISLDEVRNLTGGDYKTTKTYRDWLSGDLANEVKSVRLMFLKPTTKQHALREPMHIDSVQVINDSVDIQNLATTLFEHSGSKIVAQCNHTYILKSFKDTIHINFFVSDVMEDKPFNPFLI